MTSKIYYNSCQTAVKRPAVNSHKRVGVNAVKSCNTPDEVSHLWHAIVRTTTPTERRVWQLLFDHHYSPKMAETHKRKRKNAAITKIALTV